MIENSVSGAPAPKKVFLALPRAGRLRLRLLILGARLLAAVLGAADGRSLAALASRELTLTLRSREWRRFLGTWCLFCVGVLVVPLLYRSDSGHWRLPTNTQWFVLCGYVLQAALAAAMAQWCIHRLGRDLQSDRLDELMLTRCSAADIAMGEALAAAVASLWLTAAAFPICVFLSAIAGQGVSAALRLALSLAPAGALGVWFGMGWALTFTFRRPQAMVSLTGWWFELPFLPVWAAWGAIGFMPVAWALLSLVPGGLKLLAYCMALLRVLVTHLAWHWNPLLVVGAAGNLWPATWITCWLVLFLITVFMMRKSMDSIQLALATLPERDRIQGEVDFWIHHDGHFFDQYGAGKRRQPQYRDGGNPIAAFDIALGHRVFLHPFIWCLAIMAYLSLLLWALLVPAVGRGAGIAAVLIPATGALLLMSGGVAVSFGWERDRHRWSALAGLPISNLRMALGKIKGVVRPTLWIGLMASLTALLLGWRGTLPMEGALWMALHVLVFPVVLSCVSAVLALTTPTLEGALYWWAVLGAIPTLLTALPYPLGGEAGLALPLTPPLLALLLVSVGPTPDLIRASWISLGIQLVGMTAALLILGFCLRQWTVGERD